MYRYAPEKVTHPLFRKSHLPPFQKKLPNQKNGISLKMGFIPCKSEQLLQVIELQEKEAQKDYSIQEISLERTYSYKVSVNSRLKAI